MSEYELHVGRCKKVFIGTDEAIEEFCKDKINGEKKEFYESYTEQFWDDFYDKYQIIGNSIYRIISDIENSDGDISLAEEDSDGNINYVLQFYNGACGFEEALKEAIENMENNNE